MIQQERVTIRLGEEHLPPRTVPWTRKLMWTLGNLLMLCGVYMLLYVGGMMADEQFNIYAASGTSEIDYPTVPLATPTPAPSALVAAVVPTEAPTPAASIVPTASSAAATTPDDTANEPSDWNVPSLNNGGSASTSAPAPTFFNAGPSTITRIVIPNMIDKKVVEVPFRMEDNIQQWEVDLYRVGHHQGTSNPGGGSNIVLAGHSGGTAYPFNDIRYLEKGAVIQLYSNGQLYNYSVTENLLVDEVGQPDEKRFENAQYILPTNREMVTMVTCWPLVDEYKEDGTVIPKFSQRVILRAEPVSPAENVAQGNTQVDTSNGWVAR